MNVHARWGDQDCHLPARPQYAIERKQLKAKVKEFVANHDGGYLVIVGGMGRGKTTFMTDIIRQAEMAGECPVYHLIDYQPSESGQPEQIAACLYNRLRRKYAVAEPKEWESSRASGKLEKLLKQISSTELQDGHKEVLYIDAADQADSTQPLLPGALRHLPKGVLCVITTRADMEWLGMYEGVQLIEFTEWVDDRADMREYLEQCVHEYPTLLTRDFVGRIVTQPEPPVFLTVRSRIRQLRELSEVPAEACETAWWIVAPEERVRGEADRIIRRAREDGLRPNQVWHILGLLALAREALSEQALEEMGLWEEGVTDVILKLAASFFSVRSNLPEPMRPYHFDHPGYVREVLSRITASRVRGIQRVLADGCEKALREKSSAAQIYALRHWIRHLIAAHEWEGVAAAYGDEAYVMARMEQEGFSALHADAVTLLRDLELPVEWRDDFSSWERFMRWRIERLKGLPGQYAQEVCNEYLSRASDRMVTVLAALSKTFQRKGRLALRKVYGPPALEPIGHTGGVLSVCYSPNGQRVASGSWDGTVKVWDANSGELIADCRGHTFVVDSVSYSPDGQRVASGSRDGTVKVWDANSGELIADCRGHTDQVYIVSYSPDGQRVASGSCDHTVKVWDANSGELIADCHGHTGRVYSVSYSRDGQRVASGSSDGTVKVWDANSGELIADCHGHTDIVNSVCYSPDGQWVASGSDDYTVKVWDAHSGELIADCLELTDEINSVSYSPKINCVSYSPNGRWVASGSDDGTVRVWDARSGELVADCLEHTSRVLSVCYSPDGQRLASGSDDGTVKVWDAYSDELIADCRGGDTDWVNCICYSPDGQRIASGNDHTVKVWDANSGELIVDCRGYTDEVHIVSYSPDGQWLALGNRDGRVNVWDAHSGKLIVDCRGHTKWVKSVCYSPDGQRLASGGGDRTVKVWDANSGELIADCRGHTDEVHIVSYSSDGQRIASGGSDRTVKVWDANSGTLIADCRGHTDGVGIVCYSPDGQRVVSSGYDRTVKVWDANSGKLIVDCRHTSWIESLCYSPVGQRVVSGSLDGTVKVWDANSGTLIADCYGHMGKIRSICYSPDGQLVASGSVDGMVKVWDAQTGVCCSTIYFSLPIKTILFVNNNSLRLFITTDEGRFFGYDVIDNRIRA